MNSSKTYFGIISNESSASFRKTRLAGWTWLHYIVLCDLFPKADESPITFHGPDIVRIAWQDGEEYGYH